MELICPVCGKELQRGEKEYRCENRHSFDIARQGHVNLLVVQQKHSLNPGDTRQQVLSRRAFWRAASMRRSRMPFVRPRKNWMQKARFWTWVAEKVITVPVWQRR